MIDIHALPNVKKPMFYANVVKFIGSTPMNFITFLTFSVSDECYFRNVSCTLS